MSAQLALVRPAHEPSATAERIDRLQVEARALARGQIEALGATLESLAYLAQDVCAGGEVYPVGVREVARQLAQTATRQGLTLSAILARR